MSGDPGNTALLEEVEEILAEGASETSLIVRLGRALKAVEVERAKLAELLGVGEFSPDGRRFDFLDQVRQLVVKYRNQLVGGPQAKSPASELLDRIEARQREIVAALAASSEGGETGG